MAWVKNRSGSRLQKKPSIGGSRIGRQIDITRPMVGHTLTKTESTSLSPGREIFKKESSVYPKIFIDQTISLRCGCWGDR